MASMKYELLHGVLSRVAEDEPIFVFRADDPIALRIVQLYEAMLAVSLDALGDADERKRIAIQEKMISCNAVAEAMKQYAEKKNREETPAVETLEIDKLLGEQFEVIFKDKELQDV